MSEDETSADFTPISLDLVGRQANAGVQEIAKNFIQAISASTAGEDKKKAVTDALRNALEEVNPNQSSAHSSQAKGAAIAHRDNNKINNLRRAEFGETVAGVAGIIAVGTGNPLAKAVSEELAPDILTARRDTNFSALFQVAKECGIEKVGKFPLGSAIESLRKNVETMAAIKTIRSNGFYGDTIYAKNDELGKMPDGKPDIKGFVIESAKRLHDQENGGQSMTAGGRWDFRQPPAVITKEMRAVATASGIKVDHGITHRQAAGFTAAMAELKILGGSSAAILQKFDDNPQTAESLDSEAEAAQEDNYSGMPTPRHTNRGVTLAQKQRALAATLAPTPSFGQLIPQN